MTDSIKRCNDLVAYLKARLTAGGLSYGEAVLIDDLLTLLSVVDDLDEARRPVIKASWRTGHDGSGRGWSG